MTDASSRPPLASLCVVVHNGMDWLPGLLESIRGQTTRDFELLVVDSGSDDGSAAWLAQQSQAEPRMRLTVLAENVGYARAQNMNIAAAGADCVVLVNQDVELDPAYLATVLEALSWRPRAGSVQGLIGRLAAGGRRLSTVDTTGLVMARDRRVTSRDQGLEAATMERPAGAVWGVDGPVVAYRRTALESARLSSDHGDVEVMDESFYMYKEDVDLAWRLRKLGWEAWYEPAAMAWHGRSADGPAGAGWLDIVRRNRASAPWIRTLSWRNHRLTQVKNEDADEFLRDLPWIARRELLASAYIALADPARLAAVPSLLRIIPGVLRKRRELRARMRTAQR